MLALMFLALVPNAPTPCPLDMTDAGVGFTAVDALRSSLDCPLPGWPGPSAKQCEEVVRSALPSGDRDEALGLLGECLDRATGADAERLGLLLGASTDDPFVLFQTQPRLTGALREALTGLTVPSLTLESLTSFEAATADWAKTERLGDVWVGGPHLGSALYVVGVEGAWLKLNQYSFPLGLVQQVTGGRGWGDFVLLEMSSGTEGVSSRASVYLTALWVVRVATGELVMQVPLSSRTVLRGGVEGQRTEVQYSVSPHELRITSSQHVVRVPLEGLKLIGAPERRR